MTMSTFLPGIIQLCRLLRQEEATCHQLLETVHIERAAIRTLAITEFHSINCRRLSILESFQSLADTRQHLVQELAAHYGLQPEATSIQKLIDNVPDPASEDLRAAYRSYMTVAKTVRDEIKQNVVLIEGIRGVVDQALSSGAPVDPGRDLYTADGQSFVAGRVNVLIHQQG
ncbi:MAG: flagellar export chaperone FlgN [Nitrospira sp.]